MLLVTGKADISVCFGYKLLGYNFESMLNFTKLAYGNSQQKNASLQKQIQVKSVFKVEML